MLVLAKVCRDAKHAVPLCQDTVLSRCRIDRDNYLTLSMPFRFKT